jgi:hypothetical protein
LTLEILDINTNYVIEHAQCLTGYHVFMVSGMDLARAPRRRPLTARKKGSGYENGMETEIASFERGELPLSNDTNFNFITSLVDVITA